MSSEYHHEAPSIDRLDSGDQKTDVEEVEKMDIIKAVLRDDHISSPEEKAAAFKLAQKADPGLLARSWRYAYWWWMVVTVSVCAGDSGE